VANYTGAMSNPPRPRSSRSLSKRSVIRGTVASAWFRKQRRAVSRPD